MDKEKYIERECELHGITKHIYIESSNKYSCIKCRSAAVQRKRYNLKHELILYKGGKCEICGYNKCDAALEFHHKNPDEKEFGIAYKGYTRSLEECKKEVDKCILVCANCHREIHEEERDKDFLKTKSQIKPIKKIDKIDKNLVLSLINEGKTQSEIVQVINVSIGTLKRFLSQHNIDMRKKFYDKKQYPFPSYEEIKKHKNNGLSFTEIGEIYKIDRKTVSKIYKSNSQVAQ